VTDAQFSNALLMLFGAAGWLYVPLGESNARWWQENLGMPQLLDSRAQAYLLRLAAAIAFLVGLVGMITGK